MIVSSPVYLITSKISRLEAVRRSSIAVDIRQVNGHLLLELVSGGSSLVIDLVNNGGNDG